MRGSFASSWGKCSRSSHYEDKLTCVVAGAIHTRGPELGARPSPCPLPDNACADILRICSISCMMMCVVVAAATNRVQKVSRRHHPNCVVSRHLPGVNAKSNKVICSSEKRHNRKGAEESNIQRNANAENLVSRLMTPANNCLA